MGRGTWRIGSPALIALLPLVGLVALLAFRCAQSFPGLEKLVPMSVDPALTREGAIGSADDTGPTIRALTLDDRSILVNVFDTAPDGKNQKVELTLTLGTGSPTAKASVTWYGDDTTPFFGPYEPGEIGLGWVKIDADRAPALADERIVVYALFVQRGDSMVELRGKVRVPQPPL